MAKMLEVEHALALIRESGEPARSAIVLGTGECERRDGNMGKRKRRRGDGISG
jgi:hypothetical protein